MIEDASWFSAEINCFFPSCSISCKGRFSLIDLDATDLRILAELQKDAKLTNAELATRTNLSPSPCLTRVRALEQAGVIARYVTLLDPLTIGLGVSVFIQVSLDRQVEPVLERFDQVVAQFDEVMECHLMTGDADYLLRAVFADLTELEQFITRRLSRIEGVASIRTSISLKRVKYKTALPLPAAAASRRSIGGKRRSGD
jgi:Lrp/AsnC family leucine-responsive transcriptional regulator